MNRQIRQLEDDLISTLNGSDLPIEVKRIIVGNIYHLIEKQADKAILDEIQPITVIGEIEDAKGT